MTNDYHKNALNPLQPLTLKEETFAVETFAFSRIFGKIAKV